MQQLELRGKQGKTVFVSGDVVTIVKQGLLTGRRERTLPIRNISSVEVKKPGGFAGFIQFSIAGGVARDGSHTLTGGAFDAASDENSVLFSSTQEYEVALKIKAHIEGWAAPSQGAAIAQAAPLSTADEIRHLKALLDEGVITPEEFDAGKRKLLQL